MNPTAPPADPPIIPPAAAIIADGQPPSQRIVAARGPVFRAVLFKEARELSKSLAGGACVTAIATWVALAAAAEAVAQGRYSQQQSALPDNYFRISTFIPPALAVWLGFIQFFPEMRPARLGLLFHRPVSRGTSLAAKCLSGVVLYVIVVGLPLFAGLLWASVRRHMPFPFTWSMALIPLADVLTGIPFYAAGALIALRVDARWFGSRLVPLALALLCGVTNYVAFSFAWSLLGTAVITALLGFAAAASFRPPGAFARQPRVARLATSLMLIPAIGLSGLAVVGMPLGFAGVFRTPNYTSYERAFLSDGTPVIRRYTSGSQSFGILDVAGKVIGSEGLNNSVPDAILRLPVFIHRYDGDALQFHQPAHYFSYVGFEGQASWYLSRRGDYLVGYSVDRYRLAGAIGPGGFAAGAAAPPQRFSPPLQSLPLYGSQGLAGGDTLYHIAMDHLEPLLTLPDHDPILIAQTLNFGLVGGQAVYTGEPITLGLSNGNPPLITAVLTKSSLWFVSMGTTPPRVVARFQGENLDTKNIAVDYSPQLMKFLVLTVDAPDYPTQVDHPATLTYVGNDDRPARTVIIPAHLIPPSPTPEDWAQRILVPLITPLVAQLVQIPLALSGSPDARAGFAPFFTSESIWLSIGTGALLAICTFLIARYYGFPRRATVIWTLTVLALGPLGFFLLLSTRGLPRMVRCPACNRWRPMDEEHCRHCQAEFSVPAPDPAEIFS